MQPTPGYITGFKHKVSYYMRTIPNISDQLKKFDDVVSTEFLPANWRHKLL